MRVTIDADDGYDDERLPFSEDDLRLIYSQATLVDPDVDDDNVFWFFLLAPFQLAALMVLHAPFMAGSANDPHVHILLPARRLSANGFGLHARDVCCDEGHAEAQRDWNAFRAAGHSHA